MLAQLAAGERDAALAALADLDLAAAGAAPEASDLERVWRGKLRALRDVIADRPEVLVPVIALHHDAYVRYRERRSSLLAQQTRTETEELVDVYVDRADTVEARTWAGWVLASLAGYMFESNMVGQGARLLLTALDHDEKSQVALLALGAIEEKYGRYPEAEGYLRRLLAVAPAHAEGRLRMAMTQRRSDEVEAAEKALAGLVDDPTAWVAQLACEELAASLAERERFAEAVAVIRRGLLRFPGASRLHLELAYLLDRTNDRDGALTAAEQAVAVGQAGEGDTPRLLYNHWTIGELVVVREGLQAAATARLPQLGAALRSTSNP